MYTQDFKSLIKEIRKEALKIGFAVSTMDSYLAIWNKFIFWKNEQNFIYNSKEYERFLLDCYNFDSSTYNSQVSSRRQQLMRSKKMLDNFDNYKQFMIKRMLPNCLYSNFPSNWNITIEKYLEYCKKIKLNSNISIKTKRNYLERLLSYFYQNGLIDITNFNKEIIVTFLNKVIEKGQVSKRRNFYILRDFLNYLFIEGILAIDLSIYVPKIKTSKRIKVPVYLKQDKIKELLNNISKETKLEIRDYAIILIAATLGLRISDILNIKLKDIDWQGNSIKVLQNKNNNLNHLPLTKEIGWAIIDYIKNSRPKCTNEYLFVKMKYPFDKMTQFRQFNKYFNKINLEIADDNKKGIHNLRHSLATNMLEDGIPLNIIASTLGDTLETTSNTYLKVSNELLKQCALEIDE